MSKSQIGNVVVVGASAGGFRLLVDALNKTGKLPCAVARNGEAISHAAFTCHRPTAI